MRVLNLHVWELWVLAPLYLGLGFRRGVGMVSFCMFGFCFKVMSHF